MQLGYVCMQVLPALAAGGSADGSFCSDGGLRCAGLMVVWTWTWIVDSGLLLLLSAGDCFR